MKTRALILFSLFFSAGAFAHNPIQFPVWDIASGPSLAYLYSKKHGSGYSLNWDTSLTFILFSASCNLKLNKTDRFTQYGAQMEFSFWFMANFGGGLGYLAGDSKGMVYHLFIGAPIPTSLDKGDPSPDFIEPYYRLQWHQKEISHELGLYVKYSTF